MPEAWPPLSEAMRLDKKTRVDMLRFVILDGSAALILEGPDPALLLAAYEEVAEFMSREDRR